MERYVELLNSTQVIMNYTPRSQQSSPSSSLNNYIAKIKEEIKERGKLPLEKEVQSKGKQPVEIGDEVCIIEIDDFDNKSKDKRPKVNVEVGDEVGIIEIDDFDNKSKDKRPKVNVEVGDEVGIIEIDDFDNKSKDKRSKMTVELENEVGIIDVDDWDNKSKNKRPRVIFEVGDEVDIIEIDDWDNNGTDFAEDLELQEVLLLSMIFDNTYAKKETGLDLTDTKGKKIVRFFNSITEPGESSRTPNPTIPLKSSSPIIKTGHTNPTITIDIESSSPISKTGQSSRITKNSRAKVQKTYCKICMEATPITKAFTINPCSHVFCNSCTMNYISSKIDQNVSSVSCPDPGCKLGFLDPVLCIEILPKDVFEKWGFLLCESSLGVNNKFYCPFKDCSALLIDEGVEIINSECPHCHRMFCAKCKVPWHNDMSCSDFKKIGKNGTTKEDLLLTKLVKNKKWQKCPHCNMYVERISGCNFMRCRCGYCFCYACGTDISRGSHYCKKYMR